jgi:hypothetical protein
VQIYTTFVSLGVKLNVGEMISVHLKMRQTAYILETHTGSRQGMVLLVGDWTSGLINSHRKKMACYEDVELLDCPGN